MLSVKETDTTDDDILGFLFYKTYKYLTNSISDV